MERTRLLAIMILAVALAGAGCYTVLRHPHSYDLGEEYQGQKACADCHADVDLYHYTDMYGSGWYTHYPAPWAIYYQSPWWYQDYWYYTPDPNRPSSPAVTGERTAWSRGITTTPDPLPSQGQQNVDKPLPADTQTSEPKQTGEKPKPEPEKKKRTLWGR